MTRVRLELSEADVVVLFTLGDPDQRWHEFEQLVERTKLGERATRSALANLRRDKLATPAGSNGEWTITGLGADHLRALIAGGELPAAAIDVEAGDA